MKEILSSIDNQFKFEHEPLFENLVNYSQQTNEPIHRWFRYREGYSSRIVESIIEDLPEGKLVIDPFCGCGTTLLAAKNLGYPSLGIDANPLSAFITRVKTRNYSPDQIIQFEEAFLEIKQLSVNDPEHPEPKLSIIKKVFLPDVLQALLIIRHYIENHLSRIARDFFFLGWLSILEDVSNAYKEGNGIKYRNRKRTPEGYIEIPIDIWQQSVFPENKFDHVIDVFLKHMKTMVADAKSTRNDVAEPEVICGDAISLQEYVEPNSAGLVIFSPPYINNFNYFKAYKVELWMGGFVSDYDDLQEVTRQSLRSHVETKLVRGSDADNWHPEAIDELIELIDPTTLWTPRILQAVHGYFYDMRKVIKNIYNILENNGRCAIVVGNSAYGSTIFPTDSLLAEIAQVDGFDVEKIVIARHLTTSSQQKKALEPLRDKLRESIVCLRKPAAAKPAPPNGKVFAYKYVDELPKFPTNSPSTVYVIRNQGLTDQTHLIHKYPGKFIPHIPRWAIEKFLGKEKGFNVLDPFCGSGTTLVEARLAGHNSYGIDIDPLARLISKVKTTVIPEPLLMNAVAKIVQDVTNRSTSRFRPQIGTLSHWFNKDTINDLGIIREAIEDWKDNKDVYDFLIVCLSSIIRRVSNADNQSLKTYVSGTLKKTPASVKPIFVKTIGEYSHRLIQFAHSADLKRSSTVLELNDARKIGSYWKDADMPLIDLGVTSPPYIKTIDYIYNQMAEYFWIGDLFDLENQEKQNQAKKHYIGTEKVSPKEYTKQLKLGVPLIDEYGDRICERSNKHGYIFAKYFDDMSKHFAGMYQVLQPNGAYVVVIGNSSISDIPVPTHTLLTAVAVKNNFVLESEFSYEIRNRYMRFPRQGRGGMIDLDWVMIYRKQA